MPSSETLRWRIFSAAVYVVFAVSCQGTCLIVRSIIGFLALHLWLLILALWNNIHRSFNLVYRCFWTNFPSSSPDRRMPRLISCYLSSCCWHFCSVQPLDGRKDLHQRFQIQQTGWNYSLVHMILLSQVSDPVGHADAGSCPQIGKTDFEMVSATPLTHPAISQDGHFALNFAPWSWKRRYQCLFCPASSEGIRTAFCEAKPSNYPLVHIHSYISASKPNQG